MDNASGARTDKFLPNGNTNDKEYEIKNGGREAAAGATKGPRGRNQVGNYESLLLYRAIERQGYDFEEKDDFY
jgi:hypothetical protein